MSDLSDPIDRDSRLTPPIHIDDPSPSSDKTDHTSSGGSDKPSYSILTYREKLGIVMINSFVGIMSSIASPIFFPIMKDIKQEFKISDELMNLAVVCYLIFQGIVPTISSNLADQYGRRPMLLLSLLVYVVANIGIARSNVYWLILFLRCVQAGGIAPVIAICSGMVGDFTLRHERGSFMGAAGGFTLVGQAFGAVIGSGITTGFGTWRAIFWFLAITAGVILLVCVAVIPETCRSIVGNQSVRPKRFINRAPILLLSRYSRRLTNDLSTLEDSRQRIDWLSPLKILMNRQVYFVLIPASLQFAAWTMSMTTLSNSLSTKYGYTTLQVGLCYLPQGITCLIGSLVCGKLLNWHYVKMRTTYEGDLANYDEAQCAHKPVFNFYKARLNLLIYPCSAACCGLVMYGWFIENKIQLASVLVSSAMISFCASFYVTTSTTIMVDLFPGQTSVSASCVNLARCLTAAVGTACLEMMETKMTIGGVYTFLAGLCFVSNFLVYILIHKGLKWDAQRKHHG